MPLDPSQKGIGYKESAECYRTLHFLFVFRIRRTIRMQASAFPPCGESRGIPSLWRGAGRSPAVPSRLLCLQPHLTDDHLVIVALLGHQGFVIAALDDAALGEHKDLVGVADGGQPVGDQEGRPALH